VADLSLHVLFDAMQLFFVFVVMRVLTRRTWAAGVLFVVVSSVAALRMSHPGFSLPFLLVLMTLWTSALIRFGFLAIAVGTVLTALGLNAPITTSFSAWYAPGGNIVVGLIAALATAGFAFALAGRPWLGGMLEE